jgi:glycogen synthase
VTQIAFITYETPFAPAGGIAAVVARLPQHLQKASGLPTIVVTPFHHRIDRTRALQPELLSIGMVEVPFEGTTVKVEVLRLERNGSWVFLKAADDRFFGGLRHPYDLQASPSEASSALKRDSLLFGAAAALALPLIAPGEPWILMLQDWEAATTALALASFSPAEDASAYLTLHNSYDAGLADAELVRFGLNAARCPGQTVLDRALPLVGETVFTVSEQFALDFSGEVLQAEVMAPHLSEQLAGRLAGVDNGLFTDLSVDEAVLAQARRGEYDSLAAWKSANRARVLQALDGLSPTRDRPVWGDLRKFKRDAAPWFVMAGRDDPRQKGYDVACEAIDQYLGNGGEACFLFFPIPGEEGLPGLTFLKKLAERFPESVLVLPFLFQEGYYAALQGATYGLMPSLYEPFGMANEFYLKGTAGVGRATGGILEQIIPLGAVPSFSQGARRRSQRWHAPSAEPTGLLFREPDAVSSSVSDWQAINAANYDPTGGSPDRLEGRQRLALFRAMAGELNLCLADAAWVYREQPDQYYRMLINGIDYILDTFSWDRAAREYSRHLT